MYEKATFVCFIYMQPQKLKSKYVQINMKQVSYSIQLKNKYSYLNSSLKLSDIVCDLSCQQSYCNLLSLYKLIIIIPFILSYKFLAHLSRRLMGELIVYQSLRRPSVVCRPSSVRPSVRPQFQTSSSLKPLGQFNSNFIWRLLRTRERKFVQMVLVT